MTGIREAMLERGHATPPKPAKVVGLRVFPEFNDPSFDIEYSAEFVGPCLSFIFKTPVGPIPFVLGPDETSTLIEFLETHREEISNAYEKGVESGFYNPPERSAESADGMLIDGESGAFVSHANGESGRDSGSGVTTGGIESPSELDN